MVRITDGTNVIIVSKGAFQTQFKPFGWRLVNSNDTIIQEREAEMPPEPVMESEVEEHASDDDVADDFGDEDCLAEKPLTEMTSAELRAKAKTLGIDISEFKKKKEVIEAIAKEING